MVVQGGTAYDKCMGECRARTFASLGISPRPPLFKERDSIVQRSRNERIVIWLGQAQIMWCHGCTDHDVDPITERPESRWNTVPRVPSHDDSILEWNGLARIARAAHHVVVMLRLDDMARNGAKVRHILG